MISGEYISFHYMWAAGMPCGMFLYIYLNGIGHIFVVCMHVLWNVFVRAYHMKAIADSRYVDVKYLQPQSR